VSDARHGRRDNGLVAAEYAAAGDVDPRVGEHLLKVLALEGIAAYLRPSSDLNPVTRSAILPKRPTDRLYVDRAHVAAARDLVARAARDEREAEAGAGDATPGSDVAVPKEPAVRESGTPAAQRQPEPTSDEVDRAFAEIIAGFGEPPTSASKRDGAGPEETAADEGPGPGPYRLRRLPRYQPPAEEPSLLDGLDTFGADLPDETAESFVPPAAPPVPRPSPRTVLAVAGVVGGLAVFLKPDLLSFLDDGLAMFLGFTAIVTGFGTLVWRLRPGDEESDDPDDGARV
jgi:hypothetical protein